MRNVYLSFLGLGSYDQATGDYRYNRTVYELNGRCSKETEFVQVAEAQLLDEVFDPFYIAGTELSFQYHYDNLAAQLTDLGVRPEKILLEEDMSSEGQWQWFEAVLGKVEYNDRLTVDFTHGYRSVPIVFSAAINFLQKSRNVILSAVYYGAYDKNRELVPIVDLKEFYAINQWADGVSRLVEDADAGGLIKAAKSAPSFQSVELNHLDFIDAFQQLTDCVRNVDVNNISAKAEKALAFIRDRQQDSSETATILLDLLQAKFNPLTAWKPATDRRYDLNYFNNQLQIVCLLLEHRLFMQAYTAMRECVASICMLGFEREGMNNKKRKKRRQKYGEYFMRMVQHHQDRWVFQESEQQYIDRLMPFYNELHSVGLITELRNLTRELVTYRNGFDHGWVTKRGALEDIPEKGGHFLKQLSGIIDQLDSHKFF